MLSLSHTKMSTVSNPSDIWRSKRQPSASQWSKQMAEREKNETLKEMKPKSRPIEILSHPPEVKPFHPRNKGLARSEGLWQIYCNQPEPELIDRPAKSGSSSWPEANVQATTELLPGQHETDKESSFLFKLYQEKDFWGYFLPNTLSPEEREVSWGLSIPTDWQSPPPLFFPLDLFDEMAWEYPEDFNLASADCPPRKSKLLNLFTTNPDIEDESIFPENFIASEMTGFEPMESEDTGPGLDDSPDDEKSYKNSNIPDVEMKTKISLNFAYSMKDLLFGTPSRTDSRKRRNFSGVSHIMHEGCNFYRSNSPPVLTTL